jgi:HK97 family phage major capsid protein
MRDNRALRSERAALLKEARALSDKGRLSPAEQTKFNDLMRRADELKEELEEVEGRMSGAAIRGGPINPGITETTKEKEHRAAFVNYLRCGINGMPQEERSLLEREYRDMGSGGQGAYPGATTGYFVPVGFVNSIIETLKYFGPLLNPDLVEMMDTATGAPLPFPSENDTGVIGERIGEGQQVTDADVNIGQVLLGAWKYSSRVVKISIELLQDSAFDLEAFLIREFAKRLGRILVSDFTNGLGTASSQPMGIITSTLANGTLVPAVGSSTNDGTAAGTNTLGSDDFVNLEHGVDLLYRPGASYVASDSVWKAVRKVKDKYGRPIFEKSVIEGMPDTINGYPMLTNNFMATLQTAASSPPVAVNSVLFGNLKRFLVRRVKEMSVLVLRERWADYGQQGYLAFARYDSSPLYGPNALGQAFPFALLQNIY